MPKKTKNFKKSKTLIIAFLIAIAATIGDLSSKKLVLESLQNNSAEIIRLQNFEKTAQNSSAIDSLAPIKVSNFFSLVYVENRGISFGMFNNFSNSNQIFTFLQTAISLVVLVMIFKSRCQATIIALALIFGGAMGNVIDRWQNGAVMDFLDFHLGKYHWPAFNLADSFVFIGVCTLIILEFFILTKDSTSK